LFLLANNALWLRLFFHLLWCFRSALLISHNDIDNLVFFEGQPGSQVAFFTLLVFVDRDLKAKASSS
jgi:hypothetical protein